METTDKCEFCGAERVSMLSQFLCGTQDGMTPTHLCLIKTIGKLKERISVLEKQKD